MFVMLLIVSMQTGCRPGNNNSGPFGYQNQTGNSGSIFGSSNRGFGQAGNNEFASGYGRNNGGIEGNFGGASGINQQQYSQLAGEVSSLNQRLGAYDADNQLLNTEVAGLQQKLELANQYNQALKQQLADTAGRIKQTDFDRQSASQQVNSLQNQIRDLNQRVQEQQFALRQAELANNNSSFGNQNNRGPQGQLIGFRSQQGGSATLRANNSLMRRLDDIQIPGGQTRMDGDVIRVEFPTDRMFVAGTYQIQPPQAPVLQNVVAAIRQSFPRQIIGVEAHWDGTPLNPAGTTDHQLTATQSLAIIDELVKLGLPRNQLFMMAMASNRPRHPRGSVGGINPNRRIELVIYPESYDGS